MLYHLHELQRASMAGVRTAALLGQELLSGVPAAGGLTDALGAVGDAFRSREHPAFDIGHVLVDGCRLPVHEEAVRRFPFMTLRHFRRGNACPDDHRILLVAPLAGHFATLLRETVLTLLPRAEIWITDWHDARAIPPEAGSFGLDDCVDYLLESMRLAGPGHDVIAVCQPSVPCLAAVALMAAADDPCQPSSLVLAGGPVDARRNPTRPGLLALAGSPDWFRDNVIFPVPPGYPGAGRLVYPGFLQLSGFVAMNPGRHACDWLRYCHDLARGDEARTSRYRRFWDDFRTVMDLDAPFYLDTIDIVFRRHALPTGSWVSRGRPVIPAAIRHTALLAIEGELDDITGPGQTIAAHELCTGIPDHRRGIHVQPGCGHLGVFRGSHWRNDIAPLVLDFIGRQRRDGPGFPESGGGSGLNTPGNRWRRPPAPGVSACFPGLAFVP